MIRTTYAVVMYKVGNFIETGKYSHTADALRDQQYVEYKLGTPCWIEYYDRDTHERIA